MSKTSELNSETCQSKLSDKQDTKSVSVHFSPNEPNLEMPDNKPENKQEASPIASLDAPPIDTGLFNIQN